MSHLGPPSVIFHVARAHQRGALQVHAAVQGADRRQRHLLLAVLCPGIGQAAWDAPPHIRGYLGFINVPISQLLCSNTRFHERARRKSRPDYISEIKCALFNWQDQYFPLEDSPHYPKILRANKIHEMNLSGQVIPLFKYNGQIIFFFTNFAW